MTPYYDEGGITIYHGDWREVLPTITLADYLIDLVLTDPPYGIGFDTDLRRFGAERNRSWLPIRGDDEAFDPTPLLDLGPGRCVLFGANYYADKLPVGQWLVWNKRDRLSTGPLADAEMAWHNCGGQSVRVFNWFWNGAYRKGESCPQVPRPALHPAQKPVALMQWIVETFTTPHQVVFDPYMGSGPVAQACANLGRKYIGCEIEESYCEAAAGRLAQASFDLGGAA